MSDELHHYGVKGMKWGVRRFQPYPKGKKGKYVGPVKKAKQIGKSKVRELKAFASTRSKKLDKMSSAEIKKQGERLQLEAKYKKLSRRSSRAGTAKDREQYLRRGEMSESELRRKVKRLEDKDNLRKQVYNLNKNEVEYGKKIIREAAKTAIPLVADAIASKISNQDIQKRVRQTNPNLSKEAVSDIFNTIVK